MSQKNRSGTALAVQFVGDELRIAKVKLGSNAGVLASATLPLPEGGVRDGEIMDLESMQYTLSSAVSLPEFRGVRQVIFSIMSMQVLASEATLPHVRSEKALDRMLRANLDEYFPVSVSDHAITWLRAATAGETGLQQDRVLLWAIPREMLNGYYLLANRCGLSVKAIDYAGADLAAAAGAVYAETEQKKGRKKARRHKKTGNFASDEMALEGADARDAGGSAEIHICAETDDMLITFVREGTVRLQRIVRRSGLSEDLAECAMMLEYYASRNVNDQVGRAVLAGGCAREEGLADALSDVLGCRVESPVVYPGPEWIAHLGACTNRLDFGDASLNHPGGFAGVTKVWQYGLIAAAGALLLASILFTLTSRLNWSSEIAGLESQESMLQLQAARARGYLNDYNDYNAAYSAYSSDWDGIYGSLQTYNDNLVKILEELETTLPASARIEAMSTTELAMASHISIDNKSDAAWLLMALRELKYANLESISTVTMNPDSVLTPDQALNALYEAQGLESPIPTQEEEEAAAEETPAPATNTAVAAEAYAALHGGEAPPTKGSALTDMQAYYTQNSMGYVSPSYVAGLLSGKNTFSVPSVEGGQLTGGSVGEMLLAGGLSGLTYEELAALVSAYGDYHAPYDLDTLLQNATFEQRQNALVGMLWPGGPIYYGETASENAWYDSLQVINGFQLMLLLRNDMYAEVEGASVVFSMIGEDVYQNADLLAAVYGGDATSVVASMADLAALLARDDATLRATERLIRQDATLANKYASYLAVLMYQLQNVDPSIAVDYDALLEDALNRTSPTTGKPVLDEAAASLVAKARARLAEITPGEDSAEDLDTATVRQIMAMATTPTSGTENTGEPISSDLADLNDLITMIEGSTNTGGSDIPSLEEILARLTAGSGSGSVSGSGSGSGETPPPAMPDRYHFTVTLSYKPALMNEELARKGISDAHKVPELEVDA